MYLYFDKNGALKEIINNDAIREGNTNYNKVYCYFEGGVENATGLTYTLENPSGEIGNEISFKGEQYVETGQIPYNKDVDYKYFKDFVNYTFNFFTIENIAENGLYKLTIRVFESSIVTAKGMVTFNAENSVIKSDNNITQSQYDYLISLINDWIDLIDNKVSKKSADEKGTIYNDNTNKVYLERLYNAAKTFISLDGQLLRLKSTDGRNNSVVDLEQTNVSLSVAGNGTKYIMNIWENKVEILNIDNVIVLKVDDTGIYYKGNPLLTSVSTSNIENNAVTYDKLSVELQNYLDGLIIPLPDNSVKTSTIQNSAVTSDKLANDSVTTDKINDKAVTESKLSQDLQNFLNFVDSLIPAQASSSNQLADKDFVNSSIATNTATFKGTYTLSDLGLSAGSTNEQIATALGTTILDADENDYVFVITTNDNVTQYNRFKYSSNAWAFEYTLNNSSFTAEQWAAINSGITALLVAQIGTNTSNIANKLDKEYTAANGDKIKFYFENLNAGQPSEYARFIIDGEKYSGTTVTDRMRFILETDGNIYMERYSSTSSAGNYSVSLNVLSSLFFQYGQYYSRGEMVYTNKSNGYYRCKLANVNVSPLDDVNSVYWEKVDGRGIREYKSTETYSKGDIVTYDGYVYVSVYFADNTGNSLTNETYWKKAYLPTVETVTDSLSGDFKLVKLNPTAYIDIVAMTDGTHGTYVNISSSARVTLNAGSSQQLNLDQTGLKYNNVDIFDKSYKALYHLGAYDTVSGNVITRKTGYADLDNLSWTLEQGSDYWQWKANFIQGQLFISSDEISHCVHAIYQPTNSAGIGYTNNKVYIFTDTLYVRTSNTSERPSGLLQYELATSYTDNLIENRPLNTLDQQGSQWLRKEWEKTTNLYDNNKLEYINDGYCLPLKDFIVGQTYSYTVLSSMVQVKISTNPSGVNTWQSTNATGSFVMTSAMLSLYFIINTSTGAPNNSVCMLNEGNHAYPYQAYNGEIVHGDNNIFYRSDHAYAVNQVVFYNGYLYVCIQASTGNLPTNTTYWQPLLV